MIKRLNWSRNNSWNKSSTKRRKEKTAPNFLKLKMSIEQIEEATGFTKKEIEKLK